MTTAALGGVIEVPTIDGGRPRSPCRPAPRSGHQFRLRGKGMPVLRGDAARRHVCPGRGRDAGQPDQEAAGTAARVREAGKDGTSPESEGFFAKVKELWEDLKD